jgi:hypothetical protein
MSPAPILVMEALFELLRYDWGARFTGLHGIHKGLAGFPVSERKLADPRQVCAAMAWATALYWKPVQCLQRSVALARLLRRNGWYGRLIIGFRAMPFVSHAWVELDGVIVNDTQTYRRRLRVLETV